MLLMKKLQSLQWINNRMEKCRYAPVFLSNSKKIKPLVEAMIRKAGLTVVGYSTHQFDRGYTSVWLFKQSHLSLHSWPEYNFVTLSLEVCSFKNDDPSKIHKLHTAVLGFFKPERVHPKRLTTRLDLS